MLLGMLLASSSRLGLSESGLVGKGFVVFGDLLVRLELEGGCWMSVWIEAGLNELIELDGLFGSRLLRRTMSTKCSKALLKLRKATCRNNVVVCVRSNIK